MIKRALLAVTGVLGFCLAVTGQETTPSLTLDRQDVFSRVDTSVLIQSLPVLTLLDGRRFPVSTELGRMGRTQLDFLPLAFLNATEVRRASGSPFYGYDDSDSMVNLRTNGVYTSGEVGFSYGKSGGKYGREEMLAHIIGTVGNDKVQITVGAAYGESSGQYPRFSR